MDAGDAFREDGELDPWSLRSGEAELYHWTAPGGRGLLTNLRCLVLTRPRLFRRSIRWGVDLERVTDLSVQRIQGPPGVRISMRGSFGGGVVSTGTIDPTFGVMVNETAVIIGDPKVCADLQRRIDDARTARCMALYGRLLPYHPDTDAPGREGSVSESFGATEPPGAVHTGERGTPFVVFIAGEPFQDAVPGAQNPIITGVVLPGGSGPVESYGGHEPADSLPGQVYGPQARMARMVLDIAKKCGVSVKVVDVTQPGRDLDLVRRYVSPDDDLPSLIRIDGKRLDGSASIVPSSVEEFLRGR